MDTKIKLNYLILTLVLSYCYATDNVYQYIDNNGNLVIGNKKTENSTKLTLPNLIVMPSKQMQDHKRFSNTELKRRQILQDELTQEINMLHQSQQMLKNSKQLKLDKNQINVLEDSVKSHQQNINILNKQLGN